MSSIDERVVEAKFDNKQFQEGVKSTLSSLDSLKRGLNLEGASKGLDGVSNSVQGLSRHFSVMRIAAYTAIASITRQALFAGERIVASFTIDPIKLGFSNYEEQINAVQTILANTGLKGAKGMSQVNKVLQDLNVYANQTVYNFSEMAKNIGTFTAAGVKLQPAANAIKGIANLAAMSGASSQQASSAMYQLSQALAANQVKLQDWNSVVNAGIGGKAFQEALFNTGEAMKRIKGVKIGETFDQWVKSGHTFRQSLKDGWINAQVLSTTLQGFTGDMTVNQMKSLGYSDAQIKKIQEMGKVATEAATKIKTITQLKEALREEVGTAYAAIFKTLFGDINQAKSWLSPLHIFLENMLTNPLYAINRVLQGWSKLGGRVEFIDAMKKGFTELQAILKPIRDAFKEIFPATTAQTLKSLTDGLAHLIDHFKISTTTATNLRRTFAGLFAIVDIGWQFIKNLVHFLGELVGTAAKSSGGILAFTGNIGDLLVKLDNAIKSGQGFKKFFEDLRKVLTPIISVLGYTRIHVLDLANGMSSGFSTAQTVLTAIIHALGVAAAKVREFVTNMFKGVDFNNVLNLLNAGLFTGILLLVRKFIKNLTKDQGPGLIQGFVDKITKPFEDLTETLEKMQNALQVATLVEIAVAVGVLTASVFTLSKINPQNLAKALTAIGAMFGELMAALALFNKVGGAKGLNTTSAGLILFATAVRVMTSSVKALSELSWQDLAQGLVGVTALLGALVLTTKGMSGNAAGMIRIGAGLTILATGIRILVDAVKAMSGLSWGEIAKGLTGVGALLVSLTLFTRFAAANKGGVLQSAGLVLLASAIRILVGAVDEFGKMHWENIGKGLTAITAILAAFALFSRGVGNPMTLVASGAALVMLATAMTILQRAMGAFGNMDWENIGKGLLSMAGALAIIAVALTAMPITSVLSAAALLGVSVALVAIAGAMKIMGTMSWGDIARSLVELGGALAIIAIAMDAMITALPGAAALLVVSAALAIFIPELALMGQMSWEGIAKSLVLLAGAFVVIGAAGLLLTPVVPSLLALGASILLLGAGVAAIGGGVFLFATGLTALAISGASAAGAIKAIFDTLIGMLPDLAKALGKTLVALAQAISAAAPQLFKTAIVLFDQMLAAIDRESPKIIKTFAKLVLSFLTTIDHYEGPIVNKMIDILVKFIDTITKRMPQMVSAGTNLIVSFLHGVGNNIDKLITAGTNVIIKFIEGVTKADLRIINAAMDAIITFINGLADAINKHAPELQKAGIHLAEAIVNGMTFGMAKHAKDVAKAAEGLAHGALSAAKKVLGIFSPSKEFEQLGQWVDEGFANGIIGGKDTVMAAWQNTQDLLNTAIQNSATTITSAEQKLASLTKARRNDQQALKDDAINIDQARQKLDELTNAHKKNADAISAAGQALQDAEAKLKKDTQTAQDNAAAIKQVTAALAEARSEHNLSIAALNELDKSFSKQKQSLIDLGTQYDEIKTQIDAANQSLQDAINLRDQYDQQIVQQYQQLPDISSDTSVVDFTQTLQDQVDNTQSFIDSLNTLRDQFGLSDDLYKELLAKGPAILPFVQQLVTGGQAAVDQLNTLSAELDTEAQSLGDTASKALYQAGVDSAQGLVDGLTQKEKDIESEMTKIANAIIAALKKALKIKSPSQAMSDLGVFVGQGLADGITNSKDAVISAIDALGTSMISRMQKHLDDLNAMLANGIKQPDAAAMVVDVSSVRPVVTPITTKPIVTAPTARTAAAVATSVAATQTTAQEAAAQPASNTTNVTLIQNNTSPKALSSADIYRQTSNQISQVKGVLTTNAA